MLKASLHTSEVKKIDFFRSKNTLKWYKFAHYRANNPCLNLKCFNCKIFATFNPHFEKFDGHKNHLNSNELVFIMQKLVIIICSIFDKITNKCGPFNRWGWDKLSIIKPYYVKKCDLTVKYVFGVNFEIVWNDTYLLLIRPFLSYLRRKLTFIDYIAISKPRMKTKNLQHLYFRF